MTSVEKNWYGRYSEYGAIELVRLDVTCNWADVDAIVCCEAGGFLFASASAFQVEKPIVLVRKAGKLPPPTFSVVKGQSHISGSSCGGEEERVEIERDAIPKGASVVVVDDVLATGKTLCAVLSLLREVGVDEGRISVMGVAEFPIHCGRRVLREDGFGNVRVQSLLVFGGV
jgi:adenine phosphoribosyltransferase